MLRHVALVAPLTLLACADPAPAPNSGTAGTSTSDPATGRPSGAGELWADGSYDGVPFSIRCEGDQIVGTRGGGDPAPTTLSCTDWDAGFNVLLIAVGPTTATYGVCGLEEVSLSFTPTDDGEGQLSCATSSYDRFEVSIGQFEDTHDGVWWTGDFELVMDDGVHTIDVVGGFDAASPEF